MYKLLRKNATSAKPGGQGERCKNEWIARQLSRAIVRVSPTLNHVYSDVAVSPREKREDKHQDNLIQDVFQ